MPILPLAPDLFSTTICWCRLRDKDSPTRRAPTSVDPPAGNGTTKRTGRFGHSCAAALGDRAATRAKRPTRNFRIGKGSRAGYASYPIGQFPLRLAATPRRGPAMPFSTYLPEHMGSIKLAPPGPFVAGAYGELTLTYTAGAFGIDDTGMVKISWRTTSDMSKPQFEHPAAPNFTTVEASNGAKLDVWFDRLNIRPYANTLLIRVGRGYLRAGDTLTVRMADRRPGSPGYPLQTNCEARVESRRRSMRLRPMNSPNCRSSRRLRWCRGRP